MNQHKEISEIIKKDNTFDQTMMNTITSPYDFQGDELYQLVFLDTTNIPSNVMFYSYGATVKFSTQIGDNPVQHHELDAGGHTVINIPAGTTKFYADVISATQTGKPGSKMAFCTTW